jgi:hypothetical protein
MCRPRAEAGGIDRTAMCGDDGDGAAAEGQPIGGVNGRERRTAPGGVRE